MSVVAAADLAIAKSGPATVVAGAQATYLITVSNRGPSTASLRDIKDTLPPGVTLVSAQLQSDADVSACAGAICQNLRPLLPGAVLTMTVSARWTLACRQASS